MKTVYTIVRYYRKPYPSGNWCPRLAFVYKGKSLVECRSDAGSIRFGRKAHLGHDCPQNILHDYREKHGFGWDNINDLGEVELTVSEFKQHKILVEEKLKYFRKVKQ